MENQPSSEEKFYVVPKEMVMKAALFHTEQDGNSNNEFAQVLNKVEQWEQCALVTSPYPQWDSNGGITPVIIMNPDTSNVKMKVVCYETFGRKLH
jgi:hypothetical protein